MFIKRILKLFTNGVFLIAFFSIISRLFGFIRDRLLAANFGAGDALDSYYAAFRLPDFIFNTLIFGALGSALIPQFVKLWLADKKKAYELANNVLNILTLVILIFTIIFWILAPNFIPLITPGFSQPKQLLTLSLTRIMLASIIFFSLSTIMASILNSLKKFFSYSLAPVLYNLGIIFGIIYFKSLGIMGVAYGVVLGSFLHFLIQLIAAIKAKWRYQFIFKLEPITKKVFRLMLPRSFGLAAIQLNEIFITIFASLLNSGSLAIFYLANNIQFVPINIFGISLSTVVFPTFSQFWARDEKENFHDKLITSFRQVIYFIIPITLFFIFFKNEIVSLLLGTGKFSQEAILETALTLAYFSPSILFQSILPIITKAFYAQEDTKTPVIVSLVSILLNLVLAYIFIRIMAIQGLALSFSLSTIFNFIILYLLMKKRLKFSAKENFWEFCGKTLFSSIIAILISLVTLKLLIHFETINNLLISIINLLVVSLISLVIYFIFSKLLNIKEVYLIKKYLFFK